MHEAYVKLAIHFNPVARILKHIDPHFALLVQKTQALKAAGVTGDALNAQMQAFARDDAAYNALRRHSYTQRYDTPWI